MSRDLPASWNLDSGRMGFVVIAELPASEHVVRSGRMGPVMICEFLAGGVLSSVNEPPRPARGKMERPS